MYEEKYNKNSNSIVNVLLKNIIFSIIGYLLCAISAFFISLENDYTNLNNGLLIIILFYAQLVLITSNIIFVNKKRILNNTKSVLYQKSEIILRIVNFLIINLNVNRFGIHIYLQEKFIIIICSVILSIIIMGYQYINAIKSKDLKTNEDESDKLTGISGRNSQNIERISLLGIILYAYSISIIARGIGVVTLGLKFLVFCSAIYLIIQRLKIHHLNLNKNKLYLIISGLTIGFLLNFVLAIILRDYMNYINNEDFNGIRDIMFIGGILCAVPLLKEYIEPKQQMLKSKHNIS